MRIKLITLAIAVVWSSSAMAQGVPNDQLVQMMADLKRFKEAADDYRGTVNRLVRSEYKRRRSEKVKEYGKKIKASESEERTRRIAAITLFEEFLRRYPNDKRWTPDVIFRLAELYFEKSNDTYLLAQDQYEKDLRAFDSGKLPTSPVPPKQDYSQTINLHRRLISEFPKYRLVDGAYYLLGFCLTEMGELDLGNTAFLSLVCTNKHQVPLSDNATPSTVAPTVRKGGEGGAIVLQTDVYNDCQALLPKSKFNAEAWTRIGEFHFDENQLGAAIAAYRKVLDQGAKDNPYYDEALYKLAWTYYRADKFQLAIKHFDDLVVYADKTQKTTGKAGSEMRPESIQYLGISFSEEDWDGDQQPDTQTGMQRIEAFYGARKKERHVYEVYRRLGDIYFDTTRYDDAIKVYKLMLDRWPYRADNPDIQDKIITALERSRQMEQAIKEREEFTRRFGKGTAWEKENKNNPKALKKARTYDEQALIQAAVHHHKLGQELRKRARALNDQSAMAKAREEYALAAKAYERYLDRFPDTKNSYEIRFSYGTCLYFSDRYPEAAKVFGEVRDSNLDNRYQEDAAFSATKAWEKHISNLKAENKVTEPPLPKAKDKTVAKQPIPASYKSWQGALDAYVKLLPKSGKTPRLAYKAGEIPYRYGHFKEARKRFAAFYKDHCGDKLAVEAGQAMLVTYTIEKNIDQMDGWAKRLAEAKCGGAAAKGDAQKKAIDLRKDLRFKRAMALYAEANKLYDAGNKKAAAPVFDKAAAEFVRIVDSDPKYDNAHKALYNAGVAYEKSMRFESATKIYERVWQQYPKKDLAGNALWRSAENYKRFFEFKKAVNNYLILADAPRFAKDKNRTNAIYNAATILENDQDYRKAATLFLRYADQVTKQEDAAEAYFRAGLIYGKMKSYSKLVSVLKRFPKKYGSVKGQGKRAVEAMYVIAQQSEKRRQKATAIKYYRLAMQEYRARGLAPASDAAEYAASAAFKLAERELARFLKRKITGSIKKLRKRQTALEKEAIKVRKEYDAILAYKRVRWTLAAMYRRGSIFEHVAKAVGEAYRNAPVPKKVKKLGQDAVDIYMEQVDKLIEKQVTPLEAETKKLYSLCVTEAKNRNVSNKFTQAAERRLNALDPGAFPLLKAPKIDAMLETDASSINVQ